jgi:FixJ family two-component response regulator
MGHVSADGLAAGIAWVKSRGHDTDNASTCLQIELIVIIDDDEYARTGLRTLIESWGHKAAAFASAEEYLASNIREITSCLILDVHLLGMSGPDLQARLIANGYCPPTVFVTGRFDEQTQKRVTEAGALGYLLKPCNDTSLLDCIGRVVKCDTQKNVTHSSKVGVRLSR